MSLSNSVSQLDIVKILVNEPVLLEKWEIFAQTLNCLDNPTRTIFRRRVRDGTVQYEEMFTEILETWLSKAGQSATIGNLHSVLRELEFNNAADRLMESTQQEHNLRIDSLKGTTLQGTLTNPQSRRSPIWYKMPKPTQSFRGMKFELRILRELIDNQLHHGAPFRPITIVGETGTGKTEIVGHLSVQLHMEKQLSCIYFDGRKPETEVTDFLLTELNMPFARTHNLSKAIVDKSCYPWLMVFDGVDKKYMSFLQTLLGKFRTFPPNQEPIILITMCAEVSVNEHPPDIVLPNWYRGWCSGRNLSSSNKLEEIANLVVDQWDRDKYLRKWGLIDTPGRKWGLFNMFEDPRKSELQEIAKKVQISFDILKLEKIDEEKFSKYVLSLFAVIAARSTPNGIYYQTEEVFLLKHWSNLVKSLGNCNEKDDFLKDVLGCFLKSKLFTRLPLETKIYVYAGHRDFIEDYLTKPQVGSILSDFIGNESEREEIVILEWMFQNYIKCNMLCYNVSNLLVRMIEHDSLIRKFKNEIAKEYCENAPCVSPCIACPNRIFNRLFFEEDVCCGIFNPESFRTVFKNWIVRYERMKVKYGEANEKTLAAGVDAAVAASSAGMKNEKKLLQEEIWRKKTIVERC